VQSGNDAAGVVKALAAFEDALGDLYAAHALRFSHESAFWQELSGQEYGHGEALRALTHDEADLQVFADVDRFNAGDLREATSRMREQVAVAEYSSTGLRDALRAAIELERGLAESPAFTAAEEDTPRVARTLEHLREDSDRHRRLLLEKLAAVSR